MSWYRGVQTLGGGGGSCSSCEAEVLTRSSGDLLCLQRWVTGISDAVLMFYDWKSYFPRLLGSADATYAEVVRFVVVSTKTESEQSKSSWLGRVAQGSFSRMGTRDQCLCTVALLL